MAVQTFSYTARDAQGAIVRGSMQAADEADVVDLLRTRALFVTAVDPASDFALRLTRHLRVGGVARPALVAFFRSFATLMRAGVSIGRALDVTIERTADARLGEALRSVLADVEHGSSLSSALARRPADFPALHVAMIRAGEAGGILDDVLERLALFLERDAAMRKKLRTALAYPAVVVCTASVLVAFLIVSIVPMFAQIYDSFHLELPVSTRVLIRTSQLLGQPLPWLVAGLAVPPIAFGLWRCLRLNAAALGLDRLRLNLPIIGPLLHKAIVARVARMLATLLRSGIELVRAIDSVIGVAGSPIYAQALQRLNAGLRNGEQLGASLTATGLFDPMFLALVAVGEETGLLDEMLLKMAEYYERDVESALATLGAVLEPALIVVLGSIVGFIVCSIFIPLYSLIGSVSK